MLFVMKLSMSDLKIKIQPDFLIVLAFAVIIVPAPWLIAWLVAALIHESFHFMALKICGCKISYFCVGVYGASITAVMPSGFQTILCSAAGPMAGFLLLTITRVVPRIAVCGMIQSLVNLLPIYPLDGGRVILEVVSLFLERNKAEKLCVWLEWIIIFAILMVLCYAVYRYNLGIMPVVVVFVFLIQKKYLANHKPRRYNIHNRK